MTARPRGPACHNGTLTCFGNESRRAATSIAFLAKLEAVVAQRATNSPTPATPPNCWPRASTRSRRRSARKAWKSRCAGVTSPTRSWSEESADLLFHLLVLLRARGVPLASVIDELEKRHRQSRSRRPRPADSRRPQIPPPARAGCSGWPWCSRRRRRRPTASRRPRRWRPARRGAAEHVAGFADGSDDVGEHVSPSPIRLRLTMSCQASYRAGRISAFMPASRPMRRSRLFRPASPAPAARRLRPRGSGQVRSRARTAARRP